MKVGQASASRKIATAASVTRMRTPAPLDRPEKILSPTLLTDSSAESAALDELVDSVIVTWRVLRFELGTAGSEFTTDVAERERALPSK